MYGCGVCVFSLCLYLQPPEPDVIIHARVTARLEMILYKTERKYAECINLYYYLLPASSPPPPKQLLSTFLFRSSLGLKKRSLGITLILLTWLSIKALLFHRWYCIDYDGNACHPDGLCPPLQLERVCPKSMWIEGRLEFTCFRCKKHKIM